MGSEEDRCIDISPDEKYRRSLYKSMDDFRTQQILCDTTLIVDGVRFPAHKNILAASSPYFLGLFTTELKDISEERQLVQLEGFEEEIMEDLLRYIYTGETGFTKDNVQKLVFAADYLLITDLKTKVMWWCDIKYNLFSGADPGGTGVTSLPPKNII